MTIKKHDNVTEKIIVHAKNTILQILTHAFVRKVYISEVLLILL